MLEKQMTQNPYRIPAKVKLESETDVINKLKSIKQKCNSPYITGNYTLDNIPKGIITYIQTRDLFIDSGYTHFCMDRGGQPCYGHNNPKQLPSYTVPWRFE